MGKVYKTKRHSCPMCKPHKMGGAPKHTDRQRMETALAEQEMDDGKEESAGEEPCDHTGNEDPVLP